MALRRDKLATLTLIAGLAVAPVVFFSRPMTPWSSGSLLGTATETLLWPAEYVWFSTTNLIRDTWERYVALTRAASDNKRLLAENARLRLTLTAQGELEREVGRLRNLLRLPDRVPDQALIAEVAGRYGVRPFRSIRINRGTSDSLEAGFPVMTPEGVVGRVLRVGKYFADIQVITDGDFSLDVLLQRSRVRGVLHGFSGDRCRLQLNRQADVRIGDAIITSGIIGGFPKGLPVGRVVKISYETDNVTQIITVEPWVDYQSIDMVAILRHTDPEIRQIRESGGDHWIESVLPDDLTSAATGQPSLPAPRD
jgi:rod shape-determining protein MreC